MTENNTKKNWPPDFECAPQNQREWLARTLRDRATCLSFLDAHLRGVLKSRNLNNDEERSDLRAALVAIGEAFGIPLV